MELDVVLGGELKTFTISGARGMGLKGTSGKTTRIIRDHEATNREHFWQLWEHFNPSTRLTWEDDGAPVR